MKIDRLVSIIMLLLDKKRIVAQELADKFEVSLRTIYRDIDTISMAGIPVHAISGAGGGFEILSDYKVDKKVFSADDLSALLMGLTSLSEMVRGEEIVHALAKVRTFIPAEQAKEIELKSNQICIDLNPWFGIGNVEHTLRIVKNALEECKLISFQYLDGHSNKSERIAEPYQLVLKGNHWYAWSFCRLKNDYRLFRLARMTKLKMIDENFIPRSYQKPVLNFEGFAETLQENIKLRVHKSILDRVLEFCTFDCIKADGEDYYLVDYPFIERDYYYDMLLSFGDKCECLEPLNVREELKRRIENLIKIYEC